MALKRATTQKRSHRRAAPHFRLPLRAIAVCSYRRKSSRNLNREYSSSLSGLTFRTTGCWATGCGGRS